MEENTCDRQIELEDMLDEMSNNLNQHVDIHDKMFKLVARQIDILSKIADHLESRIKNLEEKYEKAELKRKLEKAGLMKV